MAQFIEQTLLNGVTDTTTSNPFSIEGYQRIGLQFLREDHSSGSSKFEVEGTIDGTNWVIVNTLIDNVVNAITEGVVRVASITLSSNTSKLVYLDNFVGLKAIRVKVTETTDGTHSAFVVASE